MCTTATRRHSSRLTAPDALAHAWRRKPALTRVGAIAVVLTRLPRAATVSVVGGMLKAIDLVATNVPGVESRALTCAIA